MIFTLCVVLTYNWILHLTACIHLGLEYGRIANIKSWVAFCGQIQTWMMSCHLSKVMFHNWLVFSSKELQLRYREESKWFKVSFYHLKVKLDFLVWLNVSSRYFDMSYFLWWWSQESLREFSWIEARWWPQGAWWTSGTLGWILELLAWCWLS